MNKHRALWCTLAAAAVVASLGTTSSVPDPVAGVTDEIANASRRVVQNVQNVASHSSRGSHLGFDTSEYPGDDAMKAWREGDSPYEWVGYYLPAPCHKDDSWAGKRETLASMGWGMAVVYVGQQTWGQTPGAPRVVTRYVKRRVKVTRRHHGHRVTHYVTKTVPIRTVIAPRVLPGQSCSPHLVTAARGTIEADDAIARAEAEGFPKGTVIFLDIEHMDVVPPAMRQYYKAWVARVLQDGRYRPGIYAHSANANLIYGDVKAEYVINGSKDEPPFWIAGAGDFTPEKQPTAVGHQFAAVWQGILDVVETRNGVKLKIDKNISAVRSPSQTPPQVATANVD